jgi:hypothetical protein
MISLQGVIGVALGAAASIVSLTSCRPSDSQVPWKAEPMISELVAELREFEGLASDFTDHEVLAWRVDTHENDRVEIALIWGRTTNELAKTRWALVQGFRRPGGDNRWHRSLFNRYLKAPPTHPRPSEDRDGTWHAFQMYEHAPTTREICDFAAVDFFAPPKLPPYRRISGGVQRRVWRRVAGAEPECGFGM